MILSINFEDAIKHFREGDQYLNSKAVDHSPNSAIYLLPDFEIEESINVCGYTIEPTEKVKLTKLTAGYVSRINFPEWTQRHSNPNYCRACCAYTLSSILSLVTERCVKYFWHEFSLDDSIEEAAVRHPIRWEAPGGIERLQFKTTDIQKRLSELLNILINVDLKTYTDLMRCCSLYQHSMNVRQDDHALAHSLMVSSIESVATKVIKIDDIKPEWKKIRKQCLEAARDAGLDDEFLNLLPTKLEQHYSTARFVEFIKRFAPLSLLSLPSQYTRFKDAGASQESIARIEQMTDPLNKAIHENRDNPFLNDAINYPKLLKDTYQYRSNLYHVGESGPLRGIDTTERYIKDIVIPKTLPTISKADFKSISIETNHLWSQLCNDGFVKKGVFEKDKISQITNESFEGNGAAIRQVFYQKCYVTTRILTYRMMAHISRVAITNSLMKGQGSATTKLECSTDSARAKDIELLVNRLAFRCGQRAKDNEGTKSDFYRILKHEIGMTETEYKVFNTKFMLLDNGMSHEEIIRTCLTDLVEARKNNQQIAITE